MGESDAAINSVVNYVFGGFCLILIGLVVWGLKSVIIGLKLWREDRDKAQADAVAIATASIKAVENNTSALVALKEELQRKGDVENKVFERLMGRPCLKNDITRHEDKPS